MLDANESPPYWSKNMPMNGFCGAIVAELASVSGVEANIQYKPLKRMIEEDENNDLGNPSFFLTNQDFTSIIPIAVYHVALFQYLPNHSQRIHVRTLSDMKGYKVGMLKGTLVDRSSFVNAGIIIDESYSQESLFKKLQKGRLDFVIEAELVGQTTIHQLFADEHQKFTFDILPKSAAPIAILISKQQVDAKDISNALRRGLEQIRENGRYAEIQNKYYPDFTIPRHYFKELNRFSIIYQEEGQY